MTPAASASERTDTEPITMDEAKAFLGLVGEPAAYLYAHGWVIKHTALTRACANKLRRIADLPREQDVPPIEATP